MHRSIAEDWRKNGRCGAERRALVDGVILLEQAHMVTRGVTPTLLSRGRPCLRGWPVY